MGRPEKPPDPLVGPLAEFAVGLQALRRAVGDPSFEALGRRSDHSASDVAAAVSGRVVPSFAMTLAFVRACGGDEEEWARRWHSLQERLGDEAERAAARYEAGTQAGADYRAGDHLAGDYRAAERRAEPGSAAPPEHGWLNVTPADEWLAMASSLPSGEPLPPDEPLTFGGPPPQDQLRSAGHPMPDDPAHGPDPAAAPWAEPAAALGAEPGAAPWAEPAAALGEEPGAALCGSPAPAAERGVEPAGRGARDASRPLGRGVERGVAPAAALRAEPAVEPAAELRGRAGRGAAVGAGRGAGCAARAGVSGRRVFRTRSRHRAGGGTLGGPVWTAGRGICVCAPGDGSGSRTCHDTVGCACAARCKARCGSGRRAGDETAPGACRTQGSGASAGDVVGWPARWCHG